MIESYLHISFRKIYDKEGTRHNTDGDFTYTNGPMISLSNELYLMITVSPKNNKKCSHSFQCVTSRRYFFSHIFAVSLINIQEGYLDLISLMSSLVIYELNTTEGIHILISNLYLSGICHSRVQNITDI